MIELKMTKTGIFMKRLLTDTLFDEYLLAEASIVTYNTFSIDGRIKKDFFGDDAIDSINNEFSLWKDIRPICYELIKGKHTPLSFKFVLYLSNDASKALIEASGITSVSPDQVKFGLNIKYQDGLVSLITGCSYQTFTLEKEAELIWDKSVKAFLSKENVGFEEQ